MICGFFFSSVPSGLLGSCQIQSSLWWSLEVEWWGVVGMELYGGQGQLVFYGAFRERNLWIFVEKKLSIPNLVFLFLKSLFEWVTLLPSQPFFLWSFPTHCTCIANLIGSFSIFCFFLFFKSLNTSNIRFSKFNNLKFLIQKKNLLFHLDKLFDFSCARTKIK